MGDMGYFGLKLGEAISSGAGHISQALQRKYELQRQADKEQEERARQEEGRDQQAQMTFASQGIDYDPANPAIAFSKFAETMAARKSREQGMAGEDRELARRLKEAQIRNLETKSTQTALPVAKPSTAQTAVDRAFAKEYSDYVAGGGYADTQGQIRTLEGVLGELQGGKSKLTGPTMSMLPDSIRARLMPKSIAAQQAVEQSIQRSLRQTLGAQFTEKEGEAFMKRGYDPRLSEQENAKKLSTLIDQLKSMAQSKQDAIDYYEKNGSLVGFKGKMYTLRNGELVENAIPSAMAPIMDTAPKPASDPMGLF
jgi:hypothetical protein